MSRITRTIPNNTSPFGSKGTKEVFVPRFPLVNKVTGNLASTHRKIRLLEEKEQIEQLMINNIQFKQVRSSNQRSERRLRRG